MSATQLSSPQLMFKQYQLLWQMLLSPLLQQTFILHVSCKCHVTEHLIITCEGRVLHQS